MEIRSFRGFDFLIKNEENNQEGVPLKKDIYDLDIEINLHENTSSKPEETGSYGCGQSNYCTQPNSQCICSGVNCGGTVCSHC